MLTLIVITVNSQLVINEVMASDGADEDWIEIYNSGNTAQSLQGFYISDDPDNPKKFQFSNSITHTVSANGYRRYYASGIATQLLHLSFKLSSSGESISLYNPNEDLQDSVSFPALPDGISYQRCVDGGATWGFSNQPSPNASNLGNCFDEISELPQFSQPSGFYDSSFSLFLVGSDSSSIIRYTLDGSEPDLTNSILYTDPISISSRVGDANYFSLIPTNLTPPSWLPLWHPPLNEVFKATVVRARAWSDNELASAIVTHTYFVDSLIQERYQGIPIVSIVADPKDLFNDTTGIYVAGINYTGDYYTGNYFLDWERPAHLSFFESQDSLAFSADFGIQVQGNASQASPQKGLHVIARERYGMKRLKYPLFKNGETKAKDLTEFKRFMLRSWGSCREDEMLLDAYNQMLLANSNMDLQDYRPVIVFINGEYWGLQELRESNKNEWYYYSHYQIDPEETGLDILSGFNEYLEVDNGSPVYWNQLEDFVAQNDLSINDNYVQVNKLMDVDCFINYMVHCIYFYKADWPENNHLMWRPQQPHAKWHWTQFDMEVGLGESYWGPDFNMFPQLMTNYTFYGPYPLLVSLMDNPEFERRFVNRFADFMNSYLRKDIMHEKLDSMVNQITPFMQEYQDRWQLNYNFDTAISNMDQNIEVRFDYLLTHLQNTFGLTDTFRIELDVSDITHGSIQISSLFIEEGLPGVDLNLFPWSGIYFKEVPIQVTAVANPGYQFDHWEGVSAGLSFNMELYSDTSIKAVFVTANLDDLYINEVVANNVIGYSDEFGERDDWFEIYNAGSSAINLSGLFLSDDQTDPYKFQIPYGYSNKTIIYPDSFLVFWADKTPEQGVLHVDFSLDKDGEQLVLSYIKESDSLIVDAISFPSMNEDESYGRYQDGAYNMEDLWPSPGMSNHLLSIDEIQTGVQVKLYPNPTSSILFIESVDMERLELYSINGQLLLQSEMANWLDLDAYEAGIYFLKLYSGNQFIWKKIIKQ